MKTQIKIVQITAGRGSVECCRVVAKIVELILKETSNNNINATVLHKENATVNGTLFSATIKVEGINVEALQK